MAKVKAQQNNRIASSGKINSGKSFNVEWRTVNQKLAWLAFQKHDIIFLTGPAGTGKAQPLYSKVYTPNGYKLMKDLEIGDAVSTPDGGFAKISEIFPQGEKDIYRVNFSDGSHADCCLDHLWAVKNDRDGWRDFKVLSLKEIMERGVLDGKGRKKFYVPMTSSVYFEGQAVKVCPYLVGFLLGDGGLSQKTVRFSTEDLELVKKVDECIGEGHYVKKLDKTGTCDYIIGSCNGKNEIKDSLESYGLMGCRSYEKFIPKEYKYNSIDVRFSVLQGLMDSDGTVCRKNGQGSFCTVSKQLCEDFCEIAQSLGFTTRLRIVNKFHTYKGVKKEGRTAYCVTVGASRPSELFSLARKKALCKDRTKYFPKRLIESVELIGKEEAQCIMIDHPEHLYLTDNFVVTHNTHLAMAFAISELLSKRVKKIVLTRPIVESGGEKLGFLPGELEEKVHPYMRPFYDMIDKMTGGNPIEKERIYKSIELEPIAFMRGRTYSDSICIFDEAQNANSNQLKLFMTRFDQDSKLIIAGDVTQSDLGDQEIALPKIVSRLCALPGVATVEFDARDIQRHKLVQMIIENWPD